MSVWYRSRAVNYSTLTDKQRQVFEYIQDYVEENGISPSFRNIGDHFGVSVGAIQDRLKALEKKGFLEKNPIIARAMKIPQVAQQVPILGQVHAGGLHMAFENVEGHLPVGRTLAPSQHFALKIKGDSMINAGILEGDMVIVHMQETAHEGEIVVARVDDETTVKYFRRKHGRPILEPANPKYSAIENVDINIVGVVVEVRRQLKKWRT